MKQYIEFYELTVTRNGEIIHTELIPDDFYYSMQHSNTLMLNGQFYKIVRNHMSVALHDGDINYKTSVKVEVE